MLDMVLEDLETAPGGFLLFSEAGAILDLNTTLLNMLDYPDKQRLRGQKIAVIFSIADRIFQQTHFFPLLRMQGHADEIFFRLKTREGKDMPVICNAVRKYNGDEAVIHCLFISAVQRSKYEQELLTARKEAQEALLTNAVLVAAKAEIEEKALHLDLKVAELKKINEDLLQFAKVISHDLQEPIRKIAVFADKVAGDAKRQLDADVITQFYKINKECLNLRQLAANLERFISLSAHTEPIAPVDLNEIISLAFKTAMEGDIDGTLQIANDPLPVVNGLQRQLEMLFYTIFKNSRQFRSVDRSLRVTVEYLILQQNLFQENKSAYRYVDFVRLIIRDNGTGFDPDPRINYFTILKKRPTEGFGLSFGLAFAGKVVSNHRGTISIESRIGKGTSVIISLPLNIDK